MKCPRCGNDCSTEANFCDNCGRMMEKGAAKPIATTLSQSDQKLVAMIWIGIIVLLSGFDLMSGDWRHTVDRVGWMLPLVYLYWKQDKPDKSKLILIGIGSFLLMLVANWQHVSNFWSRILSH